LQVLTVKRGGLATSLQTWLRPPVPRLRDSCGGVPGVIFDRSRGPHGTWSLRFSQI